MSWNVFLCCKGSLGRTTLCANLHPNGRGVEEPAVTVVEEAK